MTDDSSSTTVPPAPAPHSEKPARRLSTSPLVAAVAGAGLLAAGVAAGATGYGMLHKGPPGFDPTMATTHIAQLTDDDRSEIQGKVVEVFGNKFVVADDTGRALVETGRAGEGGKLVAANETVTVQGRFEKGFLHASALQRADGAIEELRPTPPAPPHERP